jgi:hypothetical protein
MESIPKGFEEKRQSLRLDMEAERIILHWADDKGVEHSDSGACIDLARHGVLVEYSRPFAMGELLEVTFNPGTDKQHKVKGQVCRCSQSQPDHFHIAMQLL